MSALAAALPLLLVLHLPPAVSATRVEQDHIRHAVVSFAATTHAFAFAIAAGIDHDTAAALSVAVGAALGIGKELVDRRNGGPFDALDLVWNGVGIAAAAFLIGAMR